MSLRPLARLAAICSSAGQVSPRERFIAAALTVAILGGLVWGWRFASCESAEVQAVASNQGTIRREPILASQLAPSQRTVATDDWVRTTSGWEHACWRSAEPRRLPHPAIVATFLLLASLLALVAFPSAGTEC